MQQSIRIWRVHKFLFVFLAANKRAMEQLAGEPARRETRFSRVWIITMKSFVLLCLLIVNAAAAEAVIRSTQSGPWSQGSTWEGGKVPGASASVLVRTGHEVIYDVKAEAAIRALHISGTVRFAPDKDTLLEVGLLKIQAGESTAEEGFDCDAHLTPGDSKAPRAALLVGTQDKPIAAGHTAHIRLTLFEGMNAESCPAIVCCGGRMEFHGAPMPRTWLKLSQTANAGEQSVTLAAPATHWQIGDRVIAVATTRQNKIKKTFTKSLRDPGQGQTEQRIITAINGPQLTLDQPLAFEHVVLEDGAYAGEVANLSRNVIVESADPAKARGHTMYHRESAGSISYAEFRHLGKAGVLGRYSLHFHLVGDSMRGASVIGASIWDSGNRWLTIHGTNYLVVRDCIGYQSLGHGFFLEDGTEINNVLDRNLAVQAFMTAPLPKQVLPYDLNDGSGFWWANSRNSFTRNVAAECDEYGYFFQVTKNAAFDPTLTVEQPDGTRTPVDIRTLPFIRFDSNEAHTMRRHSLNIGGGAPFGENTVAGIGPDPQHPFIVRDLKCWDVHWPIHPVSPSVWLDGCDFYNAEYGVWRPEYKDHYYRRLKFTNVPYEKHYAFVTGKPQPNDEFPADSARTLDLPPATVITSIMHGSDGKLVVRGTCTSNNVIKTVTVNGISTEALAPNHAEWTVQIPDAPALDAFATDEAGNVEKLHHVLPTKG
jgi:hypothetical protein